LRRRHGPGDDGLRHRLAFADSEFESVRQDALDRHELDRRLQFQVAFDAHQIQRHQVLADLDLAQARMVRCVSTPSVCTSICWMAKASFW
jgi:hypothetical protein